MGLCGPSFDGQLVSSAGFRMSSPVWKTVSSRPRDETKPGSEETTFRFDEELRKPALCIG